MERQAKDGTIYKKVGADEWEPVTRKAKDGSVFKKVGPDDWQPAEISPEKFIEQQKNSNERPWYDVKAENLIPGAVKFMENVDKYTAAPIREIVTESITGKEFDKAPSGNQQAQMLGASDQGIGVSLGLPPNYSKTWWGKISPADIYGAGLEMLQDPFILGAAAKRGLKGAAALANNPELKKLISSTTKTGASSGSGAKSVAKVQGGGLQVEQGGKLFDYKAPKSLEELREWKPAAKQGQMLGNQRLQEIESIAPDLKPNL